MVADANQRAIDMELASQRLVTEAELSCAQRISEVESHFADECKEFEQHVGIAVSWLPVGCPRHCPKC
eukprot:scaffold3052_cov389-Prasinococcus_capsulatus_cf.AAC.17